MSSTRRSSFLAASAVALMTSGCVTIVIPELASATDAATSGDPEESTLETSTGGAWGEMTTSEIITATSSTSGTDDPVTTSDTMEDATTGATSYGTTDEPDICGNDELDEGEECDDGDKNGEHAACTPNCTVAKCGDGFTFMGSDDPAENEECDEGAENADDGVCTTNCELRAYAVFVTSMTVSGDLKSLDPDKMSGLDGADKFCQDRAEDVGIPYWPLFKAWLSDGVSSPADRFLAASADTSGRPFALLDGTVIADDWDDLTDGTLDHPINVTELYVENGGQGDGVVVGADLVWSNTAAIDAVSQPLGQSCDSWSNGSFNQSGRYGTTAANGEDDPENTEVESTWTYYNSLVCSSKLRLYCFEQPALNG